MSSANQRVIFFLLHRYECFENKKNDEKQRNDVSDIFYSEGISHSYPGCSSFVIIRVVYFSVKHSYIYNKMWYERAQAGKIKRARHGIWDTVIELEQKHFTLFEKVIYFDRRSFFIWISFVKCIIKVKVKTRSDSILWCWLLILIFRLSSGYLQVLLINTYQSKFYLV